MRSWSPADTQPDSIDGTLGLTARMGQQGDTTDGSPHQGHQGRVDISLPHRQNGKWQMASRLGLCAALKASLNHVQVWFGLVWFGVSGAEAMLLYFWEGSGIAIQQEQLS